MHASRCVFVETQTKINMTFYISSRAYATSGIEHEPGNTFHARVCIGTISIGLTQEIFPANVES